MKLLLTMALAFLLLGAAAPSPDPLLERVFTVALGDLERPVSFEFRQHYDVRVGSLYHADQDARFYLASYQGATVAAHAVEVSNGGRPGSAKDRSKAERDLLAPPPFHQPFDRRYSSEYRYSVTGDSVAFVALVRDAAHGDGTFDVTGDGHVTRMAYRPCAVARPANEGSVTVERAELAPGFWGLSRLHAEYRGRQLLVTGKLVLDASVDDVHLHRTVDDAISDAKNR